MDELNSLDVWYDGGCVLCTRSRAWCEARDPGHHLRFRDFRITPDEQLPVPRQRLESSMWVDSAHGELRDGFEAWCRILLVLPGWNRLGRLAAMPPLRWLGPPLYRLVAVVRRCLPSPPPSGGGFRGEVGG